ELQSANHGQNRVALGGIGVIEHLHGALSFELGQTALELLLFANIGVAQQGKVLGLKAGNWDKVERRVGAQSVTDGELTTAGQADDVTGEGFVDDLALVGKEAIGPRQANG